MIPASPLHLRLAPEDLVGNQGIGRVCLLPGSDARARRIGERLEEVESRPSPRQLNAWLGVYRHEGESVDVLTLPTGMGCPSVNIVVTELFGLGGRRFLRVGSAGSLQHGRVRLGDLVIANASVRDESTSDAFAPRDVPALAHPDWVDALRSAATELGVAERSWVGCVHSKDAFYGREFPGGPLAGQNVAYMEMLRAMGVMATEMESSHLFILASLLSKEIGPVARPAATAEAAKAGTLLAIVGDDQLFASPEDFRRAEELSIDVALRAALHLVRMERAAAAPR
jgi:uridine phosphorylase